MENVDSGLACHGVALAKAEARCAAGRVNPSSRLARPAPYLRSQPMPSRSFPLSNQPQIRPCQRPNNRAARPQVHQRRGGWGGGFIGLRGRRVTHPAEYLKNPKCPVVIDCSGRPRTDRRPAATTSSRRTSQTHHIKREAHGTHRTSTRTAGRLLPPPFRPWEPKTRLYFLSKFECVFFIN
jgi:hypothetical protein